MLQHEPAHFEEIAKTPVRARPGAAQDQGTDPIRRVERQCLRHQAPGGMADARKAGDPQAVGESQQLDDDALDALRTEVVGRSDTGMIEGQHAVTARKLAHDRMPESAEATEPGDKNDRVAFAHAFVGELRGRVAGGHSWAKSLGQYYPALHPGARRGAD